MAVRGRKPIPTHLKLLQGNRGHRPLNENEPEFELTSIEPPGLLDDVAEAEWKRVAPILQAHGILADTDMAVLTGYCVAHSTLVSAETVLGEFARRDPTFNGLVVKTKNGNLIQNPILNTRNAALNLVFKFATELGMSPSSRSRISADQPRGPSSRPNPDIAARYGL